MFIVAEKNRPNSFYMDKASFAKLTANADHFVVDNVKVGMRLTAETKVSYRPAQTPESPLGTPAMIFKRETESASGGRINKGAEHGHQQAGKETPLGCPALSFGETN